MTTKRAMKAADRIKAELRGEFSTSAGWMSHAAVMSGYLGPVYERHLCAVLEPGTGRFLGSAVAVLRRRDVPAVDQGLVAG